MAENDNLTFLYTRHAMIRLQEYPIGADEVERILVAPDWTERNEKDDPGVVRAFGIPKNHPGKYYRITRRYDGDARIVVISVHPDRTARRPEGGNHETET